jgi:uncharacterized membrane protein YwzB
MHKVSHIELISQLIFALKCFWALCPIVFEVPIKEYDYDRLLSFNQKETLFQN